MDDFSLVPVDHQPDFENVSLVPVEHDPFGAAGVAPPAPTAQTQSQPGQPVLQTQPQQFAAGANDFFRSIPRGIVSGLNNAGSALARATQAEMGQDVDAPTPEQGMEILEREVTGPMHRPEGRAGKFGASVGESLGNPASYLVPGSLPFKVGTAVLGGLGSEAGGQLGEGTPLEVPFRFAGGALGGLGVAGLGAGVRAAETLVPAAEGVALRRAALVSAPAARVEPVGLAERATQIHNALDQVARKLRTTAVLETDAGRIIAGGTRDLDPAQRAALAGREIAAKAPRLHAEVTALYKAASIGATPSELAVTRTICPECAAVIESLGGKLASRTTAIFPRR
jgi:hypothetical protein